MTATAQNPLFQIENLGQSIWMDNLSRDLLESGDLSRAIDNRALRGITSNPSIFEKAIAGNATYDRDIEAGIRANRPVLDIYESLVFEDIRNACDVFREIYDRSGGQDGLVSLEVPPKIARQVEETVRQAKRYYAAIDRPNLAIKIPGTPEGLAAVEQVIAAGINVNITLLFSIGAYEETFWAYTRGLETRLRHGEPIDRIASVASFFVSRIDSKVDAALDAKRAEVGKDSEAGRRLAALRGKIAIANAKMAYQTYQRLVQTDRWKAVAERGANRQRLLWASTSTKDPNYSDVLYADALVGPETANTLPPATLEACADHCHPAPRIDTDVESARADLEALADLGIDLDAIMDELLEEGIDKFVKPFDALMASLEEKVQQLAPA